MMAINSKDIKKIIQNEDDESLQPSIAQPAKI